jgi:TolB-like protein
MALFSELKRRNVLRVAAAYIAVSWLVIQVIETLFPVFGLSDGTIRAIVILLAIGFVPVVALAWAFELTPEGLMRDSEIDPASPTRREAGKRLDRLFVIALALALGYFAVDKFLLDPARDRAREQEIAEAAREEGRAEAVQAAQDAEAAGPPMVAVLPFVAVGGTEDSTFFATGVHDDLLTRLAQQPSMRVISRTSVIEYKDTTKNIREIGAELGADVILEGGVQSAGERIRINAQLIDAGTDEHLWAETFDRELTPSNIFDVQTEIAQAIAAALHGTLAPETTAGSDLIPTSNMTAYRLYHEALAIWHSGHGVSPDEYRDLLREAVALDPSYIQAKADLVGSLALAMFYEEDPALLAETEQLLADIAAEAPGSFEHLLAQTYFTYYIIKDYDLAYEIATQAQSLNPSNVRIIQIKAWIARRKGDYEAFVDAYRQSWSVDPRNPRWARGLFGALLRLHRYAEAWATYQTIEDPDYETRMWAAILGAREHRDPVQVAAELEGLDREFADRASSFNLMFARSMARDYEGALEILEKMPDPSEAGRPPTFGFPDNLLFELQNRWFMGDEEQVETLLVEARQFLDRRVPDGSQFDTRALLGAARLAAFEGNTEEAERLLRRWYREGASDLPERAQFADFVCQTLAMAGAAEATVDCLRDAFVQPSYAMPFLEPYLPYYDRIREEPVFAELVAELEAAGA